MNQTPWPHLIQANHLSRIWGPALYDATGVGFVFTAEDDLCGIDLDDCIDEQGVLMPDAQSIIDAIPGYAEISPSGKGVKIWTRAALPTDKSGRKVDGPWGGHLEIYDKSRWFAVTGEMLEDHESIEDGQQAVDELWAKHFDRPTPIVTPTSPRQSAIAPSQTSFERFKAYATKMPDSIAGQAGHDAMFALCCEAVRFGLTGPALRDAARWLNSAKCSPQWSEAELEHKCEDAEKECVGEIGLHLKRETPTGRQTLIYAATDIGNADRFADRCQGVIAWCASRRAWLQYDGKRWADDETGQAQEFAKKTALAIYDEDPAHAKKSESKARIDAMLDLAKTDPKIAVAFNKLDADSWVLNCSNGTVDLKTGELCSHDPQNWITKLAPVDCDPGAEAPRFEQFLAEIFNNDCELIHFVQRLLGYSITGDIAHHILPILWGTGANGKSTLVDAVLHVLGDYAAVTDPTLLVESKAGGNEQRYELAELAGRRLVVASETDQNRELRVATIKNLTGDGHIRCRPIYGRPVTLHRQFKIVLQTNHKPRVDDNGEAIWRRLILVPFSVTIPQSRRDPQLPERLREEAPGILRWLIDGCLAYQRDGLNPPEVVEQATANYRHEVDVAGSFADECLMLNDRAWTSSDELRQRFTEFCRDRDVEVGLSKLWQALRERGAEPRPRRNGRGWAGVGIPVMPG